MTQVMAGIGLLGDSTADDGLDGPQAMRIVMLQARLGRRISEILMLDAHAAPLPLPRPAVQPQRRPALRVGDPQPRPRDGRAIVMTALGAGPLDVIPVFDVKIPLMPARAAAIRQALAALGAIPAERRELDLREHQLIVGARTTDATWQQIAARLGYQDRQAAQQRYPALTRTLPYAGAFRTRGMGSPHQASLPGTPGSPIINISPAKPGHPLSRTGPGISR